MNTNDDLNIESDYYLRKLYKKYAQDHEKTSPVNLFDYSPEQRCKKCKFQTGSIVYMFRHIREEHFPPAQVTE